MRSLSLALAVAFGLGVAGSASAELAVRNVQDGMLAVSAGGTPDVAYLQGNGLEIAVRRGGAWKRMHAARVTRGSTLAALQSGRRGPGGRRRAPGRHAPRLCR